MIVNNQTNEIICTAHSEGRKHDFKMYQENIGCAVLGRIKILLDSGYQGILKLHKNSETPKKNPKGGELTATEKAENKRLSKIRILVENIIAKVKVFKITANTYRNRRKRFGLRMALIYGIINKESGSRN